MSPAALRAFRSIGLTSLSAIALSSCGWLGAEPRPEPTATPGAAFVLDDPANTPLPGFSLPDNSRLPPDECTTLGPWTLERTEKKHALWKTTLPARSRAMFFHRAAPGMAVRRAGDERVVPHLRDNQDKSQGLWTYDRDSLVLHLPDHVAPPTEEYCLSWPASSARSRDLNLTFGADDPRWVDGPPTAEQRVAHLYKNIQEDETSFSGLFLPAPASVTWTVSVPPAAELWMRPGIVRPEVGVAQSDGATLHVDVESEGTQATVYSKALTPGNFSDQRVDLSAWAGKNVRLTLRTDPGSSPDLDYVFLGDPTVASRAEKPRRVVLVFIDTLRADHLGAYGHDNDTTPTIDAWAEKGLVFEKARSVAPWTLPSTRTMMTGRQPEFFGHNDDASPADTIQGFLGRKGWATAMYAGNVYLSATYGLNRDFDIHHDVKWPSAEDQVDQALSWFSRNEGRDAFLLLHFMDAHLPYEEPSSYRHLFAGDNPPGLDDEFHRPQVIRARLDEAGRDYVRGRYDNNIRYIDDQLARLFATLPDDAVVMLLSDHGEEFWEHGGYEHGHALWDEVVHVPLILRGPGVDAGRISEPVSMLDVAPTLLAAIDSSWALDETDGLNLLARRDEAGRAELQSRKLGLGRPLYGSMQWGVIYNGDKYTTSEGVETLFHIAEDPGEEANLFAKNKDPLVAAEWREHLSDALPGTSRIGYRIIPSRPKDRSADFTIKLTVPGGVDHVIIGTDPLEISAVTTEVNGDEVTATWVRGLHGTRELFVVPTERPIDVTPKLELVIDDGRGKPARTTPRSGFAPTPDTNRTTIMSQKAAGRSVQVTWGMARIPAVGEGQIIAASEEQAEWLRKLGYTDDAEEKHEGEDAAPDEHEDSEAPVLPAPTE